MAVEERGKGKKRDWMAMEAAIKAILKIFIFLSFSLFYPHNHLLRPLSIINLFRSTLSCFIKHLYFFLQYHNCSMSSSSITSKHSPQPNWADLRYKVHQRLDNRLPNPMSTSSLVPLASTICTPHRLIIPPYKQISIWDKTTKKKYQQLKRDHMVIMLGWTNWLLPASHFKHIMQLSTYRL